MYRDMSFLKSPLWLGLICLVNWRDVSAQCQLLTPQTDTFASSASISASQAAQAGINASLANNIAIALNFERSNFANGSVTSEDFYTVPKNAPGAAPGTLLKLQLDANTSAYTLPPNTALSRFMFQSETLNGTAVPVSAYILWPYLPRNQSDGYPVVAWSNGNSGSGSAECAPSHYRNLLYQFATIFELALQGYVVVSPDYAGLGVTKDASGNRIVYDYLGSPSHANDLFYAVEAAQTAFSSFSKQFVVMGHSEGGGGAWAAAQRQVQKPVAGYLGAISGSPVTNTLNLVDLAGVNATPQAAIGIANTLAGLYPGFKYSDILTPAGIALQTLLSEIKGCGSTVLELFAGAGPGLVQPAWTQNFYVQSYQNLTVVGGKPFAGPMLILQGIADATVAEPVTSAAVQETCQKYPDSQLEYLTFVGVDHVSVMFASQRLWLDWIAARFAGEETPKGCQTTNYSSVRAYEYYQKEQIWFVEFATAGYETA